MKKLFALLLAFICLFGCAYSESSATPTDLEELYEIFEDDDYGHIDHFDRQVFLQFLQEPPTMGEEVTLVAILVNFLPTDNYSFEWQYSKEGELWYVIKNATDQTYTFVLDQITSAYWWRVKVTMEE